MNGDMTQGSSLKALITFSVPLMLENILQQLYYITDAVILGRFVGKNALAAVGVANPIMSTAIFFMFGVCIGTAIFMSQIFGAAKYEILKREVSTALIAGAVFTGLLSIISVLSARYILIAIGTPEEIMNDAEIYLKILSGGLIFSFLYNFYSFTLKSIGDSKTPFIFLSISCVLNGILCYCFVALLGLGVVGSAAATIIAQVVSSVMCISYVYIKVPMISLKPNELVMDKSLLRKTIKYSSITALQQISLYMGKLLVQGVVNPFGTNTIAAYNTVTRIDAFVLSPGDNFVVSVSTYTAQNMGARKWKRIIEGYKIGNIIITIYNLAVAAIVFFGAEKLMHLFISASEREVIMIGVEYLRLMPLFYVLTGFCNIFQGIFRGIGKLHITFFATVTQVSARVILALIFAPYFGISGICYAVGIGWVIMIIYEGLIYRKEYLRMKAFDTAQDVLDSA
ncbi:MAG TPA: MATE family efflux transporter [Bacillota bacterium]|nr:MATE family efflux transporter [Bacillota bacterium]HNT02948.1 MATE family efflux transporter [Bacillota bacterium]HPX67754.1 MATE family efflux transporter [Bacillota bacterium]HQA64341.1 MATE family efflux transporter [Bacillota bacterium]